MANAARRPAGKSEFPWWLVAALVLAAAAAAAIFASDLYSQVFATVAKGIGITIAVTLVAFAAASAIGLGIALMALSGSAWLRQTARFYVEIIRGVPILVLLFWIAFAGVPAFVAGWNFVTAPLQEAGLVGPMQVRSLAGGQEGLGVVDAVVVGRNHQLGHLELAQRLHLPQFLEGVDSVPRGDGRGCRR